MLVKATVQGSVAGKVVATVSKMIDGVLVPAREHVTHNNFTRAGFAALRRYMIAADHTSTSSTALGSMQNIYSLPSATRIHLGTGVATGTPDTLQDHSIMHGSNASRTVTDLPARLVDPEDISLGYYPRTHQIRFRSQFTPRGAAYNYTELGLGATSTSGNYLYTYALFLDSSGEPAAVTVGADEYLTIEYSVQLSYDDIMPGGVPVTGQGVPTGCLAYFLQYAGTSNTHSSRRGYQAYTSATYSGSGWEDADFERAWLKGASSTYLNASTSPSMENAGKNTVVTGLSSRPTVREGGQSFPLPPGTFTDHYVVIISSTNNPYYVILNKGIHVTADDSFDADFRVQVDFNWSNTTWLDDPDADRTPIIPSI